MVLAEFLVNEGSWNGFGWLGAEEVCYLCWQVFAQKQSGERGIAQNLLEEGVVDVGGLG